MVSFNKQFFTANSENHCRSGQHQPASYCKLAEAVNIVAANAMPTVSLASWIQHHGNIFSGIFAATDSA
jgi:hypothetical protein